MDLRREGDGREVVGVGEDGVGQHLHHFIPQKEIQYGHDGPPAGARHKARGRAVRQGVKLARWFYRWGCGDAWRSKSTRWSWRGGRRGAWRHGLPVVGVFGFSKWAGYLEFALPEERCRLEEVF
jgi:hypothetical protein